MSGFLGPILSQIAGPKGQPPSNPATTSSVSDISTSQSVPADIKTTSSQISSTSSSLPTSSISSTSSSSSTTSSTSRPTLASSLSSLSSSPSPTPSSSIPSLTTSISNGQPTVVTTFISAAPSAQSSSSAPASHTNSFLQNKPLSGTVFALVGLLVIILIVVFVTMIARKRQRDRLVKDAAVLSFDPNDVEAVGGTEEKFRLSGSYSNHSQSHLAANTYNPTTAPNATYLQHEYGGTHGSGDPGYTSSGYNDLMPNPYTTYGNPVYQSPRSPSPVYGVSSPAYDNTVAHPGTRSIPPAGAQDMARGANPSPQLPSIVQEDDVYGGITSVDNMETRVRNSGIPRALQVRNM